MSTLSKKSKLSAIPDQQSIVPQSSPIPRIKDEPTNRTSSSTAKVPSSAAAANSTQLQEEKRQAVRKLIESIPTKKEDLFAFPLDWSLLDSVRILVSLIIHILLLKFQNLMEKRIKPWVTKKIVEYLGEEESALTDFICTSIMSKKNADFILADIRVVLDDEAEVFVVKMWRLIVYEIEAKRNGLNK